MAEHEQIVQARPQLCRFCGSALQDGCRYCQTCSHHQSILANIVRYGVTGIAFLSILATAATYVVGAITEWRKTPALAVGRFSTYGDTTFVNTGPGSIFVERIDITAPSARADAVLSVNKTIGEGDALSHTFGGTFQPNSPVRVGSEQHWTDLTSHSTPNIKLIFLGKDDPNFAMWRKRLGTTFRSLPGEATIVYYSFRDGVRYEHKIEISGYYAQLAPSRGRKRSPHGETSR